MDSLQKASTTYRFPADYLDGIEMDETNIDSGVDYARGHIFSLFWTRPSRHQILTQHRGCTTCAGNLSGELLDPEADLDLASFGCMVESGHGDGRLGLVRYVRVPDFLD